MISLLTSVYSLTLARTRQVESSHTASCAQAAKALWKWSSRSPTLSCHYVVMDEAVIEFETEARRYCSLVEGNGFSNSWDFAQACLIAVLRLLDRALRLPEIEPETTDILTGSSHEKWQAVRQDIGRKLARDYYWEIFEPFEEEEPKPVLGSLSDDLADIWRDLKSWLAEFDRGKVTSTSDAVWHWRFKFETHWGHHAAGAVVALNALCFGALADGSRPQAKSA